MHFSTIFSIFDVFKSGSASLLDQHLKKIGLFRFDMEVLNFSYSLFQIAFLFVVY